MHFASPSLHAIIVLESFISAWSISCLVILSFAIVSALYVRGGTTTVRYLLTKYFLMQLFDSIQYSSELFSAKFFKTRSCCRINLDTPVDIIFLVEKIKRVTGMILLTKFKCLSGESFSNPNYRILNNWILL